MRANKKGTTAGAQCVELCTVLAYVVGLLFVWPSLCFNLSVGHSILLVVLLPNGGGTDNLKVHRYAITFHFTLSTEAAFLHSWGLLLSRGAYCFCRSQRNQAINNSFIITVNISSVKQKSLVVNAQIAAAVSR